MTDTTVTLDRVLDITQRLSQADQLRLISLLSGRLCQVMPEKGKPVDLLSLAGLGEDLWHKIDVDAYLEQERASWEG